MKQNNLEKKCIINLYKIIKEYYDNIRMEYQKLLEVDNKEEMQKHIEKRKELLDYEISIYKNLKYKLITFTQLFDENNLTPYLMDEKEAEILRDYIGLYNDGIKMSDELICQIHNITKKQLNKILKEIVKKISTVDNQKIIYNERNKIIKDNISNEKLKQKILHQNIKFINISENLISILNQENITNIEDLINITYEMIQKINYEYGYDTTKVYFSKRLLEEIEALGLSFTDTEIQENIKEMSDKKHEELVKQLSMHTLRIKTFNDVLAAHQLEPEILEVLEYEQRAQLEQEINEQYIQQYQKVDDKIQEEIQKLYIRSITEQSPEEIIKKKFPLITNEQLEQILEKSSIEFKLYKK